MSKVSLSSTHPNTKNAPYLLLQVVPQLLCHDPRLPWCKVSGNKMHPPLPPLLDEQNKKKSESKRKGNHYDDHDVTRAPAPGGASMPPLPAPPRPAIDASL